MADVQLWQGDMRRSRKLPAVELYLPCWHAHTPMPSYANCGTAEAKPLSAQRSGPTINRTREDTNKPDIRSDSSVDAILGGKRPWKHHITHDRQMINFYS